MGLLSNQPRMFLHAEGDMDSDGAAALAAARLRRAIASGSRERDMAILRGIQNLRRGFPMKSGVA